MIDLPTATDKVWLYSDTYGLPTCVEVPVTATGVHFNLDSFLESAAQRQNRMAAGQPSIARSGSTPENVFNIQTPLGGHDRSGKPDYLENNLAKLPEGLINRVQNVLLPGNDNSQYAKPADLVNLTVAEPASLNIVFLAELSLWTNSFGYYYYDTDNPPANLEDFLNLPKYIVFPNCSMYNREEDYWNGYFPPLKSGMQVKLKYFDGNGNPSDIFPAGVTVGWFIMPGGFRSEWGQIVFPANFDKFKCSNSTFNNFNKEERFCVSLYDKPSGKTIIGFEDGADNDYKDVLFFVESDPESAIVDPDRPVIDPDDEQYPDVAGDPIEGTLAFEDLWPSQGDYDMNDVVIAYSTTFTIDKDNKLIAVKDVFTPLHSGGSQKSAFGYQLDMPGTSIKKLTGHNITSTAETIDGLETGQEKPVIMLFDDIARALAKDDTITVIMELDGSVSMDKVTYKSLYNPFICVSGKEGFVPGGDAQRSAPDELCPHITCRSLVFRRGQRQEHAG